MRPGPRAARSAADPGRSLAVAVLASVAAAAVATGGPGAAPSADLPFSVGEEARYRMAVALGPGGPRPVGSARLAVEAREDVEGREAYRVVRETEGSIPFVYSMDDRQVSWIAPDPFRSLRFEEHLRQGDYRRHRRYRLDQAAGTYTRWDRAADDSSWHRVEAETGVPMPPDAMDEVAFLYFVRTLPLEPGTTRTFHRLFQEDDNPVHLEVLRRERVRVPAGTFETVVVRPVMRTGGLFGREGRAEVYLSDDARRVVVKIESRLKVGRIELNLEEYRPGSGPP